MKIAIVLCALSAVVTADEAIVNPAVDIYLDSLTQKIVIHDASKSFKLPKLNMEEYSFSNITIRDIATLIRVGDAIIDSDPQSNKISFSGGLTLRSFDMQVDNIDMGSVNAAAHFNIKKSQLHYTVWFDCSKNIPFDVCDITSVELQLVDLDSVTADSTQASWNGDLSGFFRTQVKGAINTFLKTKPAKDEVNTLIAAFKNGGNIDQIIRLFLNK